MENQDSIKLLRECDSGTKMAVTSIDDVLDKVEEIKLKDLLVLSKKHHEELGNKIHEKLLEYHSDESEPDMMAKGMSWIQTNMKFMMKNDDSTIADIITDGCDMGIKSLHKYLNQYENADKASKDLCNELINIEEELREKLRVYL